jgi:hypothetical protein
LQKAARKEVTRLRDGQRKESGLCLACLVRSGKMSRMAFTRNGRIRTRRSPRQPRDESEEQFDVDENVLYAEV